MSPLGPHWGGGSQVSTGGVVPNSQPPRAAAAKTAKSLRSELTLTSNPQCPRRAPAFDKSDAGPPMEISVASVAPKSVSTRPFDVELNRLAERTKGGSLSAVLAGPPHLGAQQRDADVGTVGRRDPAHGIFAGHRSRLFDRFDAADEFAGRTIDHPIERRDAHRRASLPRPLGTGRERHFQHVGVALAARDAVGANFERVRTLARDEREPGTRNAAGPRDEHSLFAGLFVFRVVRPLVPVDERQVPKGGAIGELGLGDGRRDRLFPAPAANLQTTEPDRDRTPVRQGTSLL